jgi:hypothetical protein
VRICQPGSDKLHCNAIHGVLVLPPSRNSCVGIRSSVDQSSSGAGDVQPHCAERLHCIHLELMQLSVALLYFCTSVVEL